MFKNRIRLTGPFGFCISTKDFHHVRDGSVTDDCWEIQDAVFSITNRTLGRCTFKRFHVTTDRDGTIIIQVPTQDGTYEGTCEPNGVLMRKDGMLYRFAVEVI